MNATPPGQSQTQTRSRAVTAALFVVPVLFGAVFFAYPVVTLLDTGLRGDGRFDLAAAIEVVTASSTRRVAWFTLWQAVASTAATVVVAMPAAYLLGRVQFRGRRVFSAALIVPFVLPTVVVGTAFSALLASAADVVDLRRTALAIIAAHVFFNYAVIARTVGGAWMAIDPDIEAAARTLGASRWTAWRTVTLPQLRPAIAGAASIVFLFTFTSFGVVKILGGPTVATIEVEIHRLTTEILDLRTAAVLSLIQMAAVVAALGLYRTSTSGAVASGRIRLAVGRSVLHRARGTERFTVAATILSAGIVLGTPLAMLVWRSFDTATGPGLAFYRALSTVRRGSVTFVPPVEAIRNSLLFGLAAAATATVVGVCAAVGLHRLARRPRNLADVALMLPLGTSAVTVGLGFLLTLDTPPLDLRTSPVLIPAAQALLAVPFVIRTVTPALDAIPTRAREVAATLGATPWQRVRHVDVALLRRPVLGAFGFAFAISLGEFGATVFIARADAPTVPVAIFRALSQPGSVSVGMAMALSTILLGITTLVMVLVDRVGDTRVGRF